MKKLIPKILLSIMLSTAMVASVKFDPIRTPTKSYYSYWNFTSLWIYP